MNEYPRSAAAQESVRLLLEQELARETTENIQRAKRVIEKIFEWAEKNNIEIASVERLKGGFVNLVLLIETPTGESYVVKAFADEKGAQTTRDAQTKLSEIAKNDTPFIPEAVAWIDDETVVSTKAEGFPIRKLFESVSESEDGLARARIGFSDLGRILGSIHERTERVMKPEDDPAVIHVDEQKITNQFRGFVERGLLHFSKEEQAALEKRILAFTQAGAVSVIHGDSHLDQFFCAPDRSLITIIDYDTVHEGDPMADVARALASIRDHGEKMGVSQEHLREIESSFFQGYRAIRFENLPLPKSEFDQYRIIVYELRLFMVQLWQFNDLLEKVRSFIPDGMSDGEFLKTYVREQTNVRAELNVSLSKEEQERFDRYLLVLDRMNEILEYLQKIELEEAE